MAAGVPVIASDIAMNREVLGDGAAMLVAVGDTARWREALFAVFNERKAAEERAAKARARVLQRFDINEIVGQHESMYERLLEVRT
jgi:glycosyltransferase involved in cell wall biosynthesis